VGVGGKVGVGHVCGFVRVCVCGCGGWWQVCEDVWAGVWVYGGVEVM
jgi:hypothetical protein